MLIYQSDPPRRNLRSQRGPIEGQPKFNRATWAGMDSGPFATTHEEFRFGRFCSNYPSYVTLLTAFPLRIRQKTEGLVRAGISIDFAGVEADFRFGARLGKDTPLTPCGFWDRDRPVSCSSS